MVLETGGLAVTAATMIAIAVNALKGFHLICVMCEISLLIASSFINLKCHPLASCLSRLHLPTEGARAPQEPSQRASGRWIPMP